MSNLQLPGNPRYQPKDLVEVFGYDNLYQDAIGVEIATLETLGDIGVIPKETIALLTDEVKANLLAITTTQVDTMEREMTKHDIRALVRLMQERVHHDLQRWIHVPLTSYDVLDTARSLQFVRAHKKVRRLAEEVIKHFITHVRAYADTTQIGRTHGQHALPITVGFWFATILNRIVINLQSANAASAQLVGKISGAVGAYNAQTGLGISEKCGDKTFEELVLAKLGLEPAPISTQILPPEPLADYLFACIKLSASLGQFGRDGRNLMRTEIAELGEPFDKGQVGSSTMAHKRNPINFENLEGTWLKNQVEFGKVLSCMISDHQRDLVGSSIMRDFPTIVVNVVNQLNTLLRKGANGKPFIARIAIDIESCKRNLSMQGDEILAEPIYIALQMAGYEGDAHELVNHQAMPYAAKHDMSLFDAVNELAPDILVYPKIPIEVIDLLSGHSPYVGIAAEKAKVIADQAERYLVLPAMYQMA